MSSLRSEFLLDPDIIYLNHGSFGACPRPVFEAYQAWQRRLERQPVRLLGRELASLLCEARLALGAYLHAEADDLVFIPNATHGVNIVARSLKLQPGDEILTGDHEYGACDYTWEYITAGSGARYIHQALPAPLGSDEEIVAHLWQGVNARTRAIFLSHITSPTAARLPVEAVCRRARSEGILTVIDGAHAPGQIDLDLNAIGADFYTGNCHKWMLAPKGAAFLYARRLAQPLVEPLVVSWGYRTAPEIATGSRFLDLLQWNGTYDPSAALSVPAAIDYQAKHNWPQVRGECHALAVETRRRIQALTGLPGLYGDDRFHQMFSAELPPATDTARLKEFLYNQRHIEVPILEWNGRKLMRVSIQGYNKPQDCDGLLAAFGAYYGTVE